MNITIIGAGNSGLAFAAHLKSENHRITLWNRSVRTIELLMKTKKIKVNDKVNGVYILDNVTSDLEKAVQGSDLIVIATPQYSHEGLARRLSEVKCDSPILMSPGGIFGVILFDDILKSKGNNKSMVLGTQTVIYTSRKVSADEVNIMKIKNDVYIAGRNYESSAIIWEVLPKCWKGHLKPVESLVTTSISDINMIVHCAPMILNVGWIESPNKDFLYYHEGFTETVASFCEKVDAEKLEVAKQLGFEVESTYEWIKRSYNIPGKNLYECFHTNPAFRNVQAPKTLNYRYILEDLKYGLVSIEALGKKLGINMKYMSMTIDMGCALLNEDFRNHDYLISLKQVQDYIALGVIK